MYDTYGETQQGKWINECKYGSGNGRYLKKCKKKKIVPQ